MFSPARNDAASAVAMSASVSKRCATARAHITARYASGRRVHGWKTQEGNGSDIFSELHCTCTICTESKTESPSLRKFEGNRYSMSEVTGKYMKSNDPYISKAMHELEKLDVIEQASENETATKPAPVELCRRSTKPREYWHADAIPLGNTWNKMKHALVIVDDFTRTSFIYLMNDTFQHMAAAALQGHFLQQSSATTGTKGINFFYQAYDSAIRSRYRFH